MRAVVSTVFTAALLVACSDSAVEAVPKPSVSETAMSEHFTPESPRAKLSLNELEPSTPPKPNGDDIYRLSDIDFTTYSLELASHLNIEVGETKGSVEDKVHAAFRPHKMPDGKGHVEYALTELKAEGGSVLLATAKGLADDSVKAQQLYVIFQDEMLVTYGMKVKCWRSKSPDDWQNTLCP